MRVAIPPDRRNDPVTRKKPESGPGRPAIGKQVAFRADNQLAADLEDVGDGLDLDISSVVRMILAEQIGSYKERARQARAKRQGKED